MTRIFAQSIASTFFARSIIFRYIAVFQFSRPFSLSELILSSDIEIGYTRIEIIRAGLKQFTGGASLCTYVSPRCDVYTVKSRVKRYAV